jgi:DNA-binding NarL/FixJ family response regulator
MRPSTALLVRSDDCGWSDLRLVLASIPGVRVVGEATDGARADELAVRLLPSVVIASASLNGASTVPLLARMHDDILPGSKIIVISRRFETRQVLEFSAIRASAQLVWDDLTVQSLSEVLSAIMSSDIVVMSRTVSDMSHLASETKPGRIANPIRLNVRERGILFGLAEGLTYDEIARVEKTSRRTVARIIAALEAKLDAPTQFALGRRVTQLHLLD